MQVSTFLTVSPTKTDVQLPATLSETLRVQLFLSKRLLLWANSMPAGTLVKVALPLGRREKEAGPALPRGFEYFVAAGVDSYESLRKIQVRSGLYFVCPTSSLRTGVIKTVMV